MIVTREQLHAEIWKQPMGEVAKRYGVSGTFLTRICKQLNIPRPPLGHWAKVRAGKGVTQIALPEARVWDKTEWAPHGRWEETNPPKPELTDPDVDSPAPTKRPLKRHRLIAGVLEHFQCEPDPDNGYLRPETHLLPDIVVSPAKLKRAFSTFRRLIAALEERGHRVTVPPLSHRYRRPSLEHEDDADRHDPYRRRFPWSPAFPTLVVVGKVAIGLTLFEVGEVVEVERINDKWVRASSAEARTHRLLHYDPYRTTTHRRMPSGNLALRAYCPYIHGEWKREWREEKGKGVLAGKLDEIADKLEAAAMKIPALYEEAKRKADEEQERLEREWAESQRRWAEERRAKQRAHSLQQLKELAGNWSTACNLEQFLTRIEKRATELQPEAQAYIAQNIAKARELLGGTDALAHFAGWKPPEKHSEY